MVIKRPKSEELVVKLRQVEVLIGHRMPRIDAIKQISVIEQTYYRWNKKCGGMARSNSRNQSVFRKRTRVLTD